jgi:hypothetical protein
MRHSPYISFLLQRRTFALGWLVVAGCALAEPQTAVENETQVSDLAGFLQQQDQMSTPASMPDLARPPQQTMTDTDGGSAMGTCDLHKVRINEVATQGAGGATDEFVELYNPCNVAVPLSAGRLVYRAAAATSDTYTLYAFTTQIVPAKGWFVVANGGFSGIADLKPFQSGGLASSGGGVALEDGASVLIDSVAWGTASNAFIEGSAAPAPSATQSIARVPDGTDTNNNAADFQLGTPTPGTAN